eukprot:gnl/Spiro4/7369_TR3861_c1_g1_i1.p2 gnl/Spiro4/7369_TR3861_c1_g1~~gnl/Spiro4/7369_TR3861_c1_g1_i1.p2  ORF type:complete len:247 (+),score=24.63 gnl/Spiro4/7369_TR3861_c1_g1_i1:8222-8962(+)
MSTSISCHFFDIDYLFIALRAKSVGESIDIKYTCNNVVDGNACGAVFPATIDITNCKVVKDDTISNEVLLPGQIKVKLKYPNYSQIKAILDDENVIDKKIKLVVASIDYIQEREKIISLKDTTPEELTTFVESLTQEQYHKLEHWIDNFPSFVITSEATCKKCGFKHQLEYNDFDAFFRLALGYDNLANWYQTMFSLVQFHKWPPEYIESLIPFEKMIYIDMLSAHIKHENDMTRDITQQQKRMRR